MKDIPTSQPLNPLTKWMEKQVQEELATLITKELRVLYPITIPNITKLHLFSKELDIETK